MLAKKPALIVTFDTTTAAMAMEKFCAEHQLPGRLIPVPRAVTAGCGLAWKAPPEEKERLTLAWKAAGLRWSAMYQIEV
jgi:hypothetical protein